jgi:hypothetical protein
MSKLDAGQVLRGIHQERRKPAGADHAEPHGRCSRAHYGFHRAAPKSASAVGKTTFETTFETTQSHAPVSSGVVQKITIDEY